MWLMKLQLIVKPMKTLELHLSDGPVLIISILAVVVWLKSALYNVHCK